MFNNYFFTPIDDSNKYIKRVGIYIVISMAILLLIFFTINYDLIFMNTIEKNCTPEINKFLKEHTKIFEDKYDFPLERYALPENIDPDKFSKCFKAYVDLRKDGIKPIPLF